jgi:hypothetical protein
VLSSVFVRAPVHQRQRSYGAGIRARPNFDTPSRTVVPGSIHTLVLSNSVTAMNVSAGLSRTGERNFFWSRARHRQTPTGLPQRGPYDTCAGRTCSRRFQHSCCDRRSCESTLGHTLTRHTLDTIRMEESAQNSNVHHGNGASRTHVRIYWSTANTHTKPTRNDKSIDEGRKDVREWWKQQRRKGGVKRRNATHHRPNVKLACNRSSEERHKTHLRHNLRPLRKQKL